MKTESESLKSAVSWVLALTILSSVLMCTTVMLGLLWREDHQKLLVEMAVVDIANDKIAELERRVQDQAKLIVKRPVVYKSRVVYRDLP